eukprot:13878719-Heterocapsa_arctica.AAC.1
MLAVPAGTRAAAGSRRDLSRPDCPNRESKGGTLRGEVLHDLERVRGHVEGLRADAAHEEAEDGFEVEVQQSPAQALRSGE